MRKQYRYPGAGISLSRRRFVQGMAAGTALAGLAPSSLYAALQQQGPQTLRGNTFHLTLGEQAVNFLSLIHI